MESLDKEQKLYEKNVLVILASASKHSSNRKLMELFQKLTLPYFSITILDNLETLPHFDAGLTENLPETVSDYHHLIESAGAIVICTPEYIFSIPSRLKNLMEWCVATTIFNDKPVGLITASADGRHGHTELKLIMSTLGAKLSEEASLLIPGIKGKFNADDDLIDPSIMRSLEAFSKGLTNLLN